MCTVLTRMHPQECERAYIHIYRNRKQSSPSFPAGTRLNAIAETSAPFLLLVNQISGFGLDLVSKRLGINFQLRSSSKLWRPLPWAWFRK